MPQRRSPEIHAIILTLDEEKHIVRCINSIRDVCASMLIVNSGSKDRTREIAEGLGARVIEKPWVNYATQFNHGIAASAGGCGWFLRINSDEYLTPQSAAALHGVLAGQPATVDGVLVKRQIVFLGRQIRWGGVEPNWQLRLWRCGHGACEQRWMDEHIVVDGDVVKSRIEIIDENLNSLDWWTAKHNRYASREVIDILASRGLLASNQDLRAHGASPQAKLKRLIKDEIYNRLPGGLRSLAYLFYRYILRLGFLDGKPGFYFHALQGFWYRTLVDAKLTEVLEHSRSADISMEETVRRATGIEPIMPEMASKNEDANSSNLPAARSKVFGVKH